MRFLAYWSAVARRALRESLEHVGWFPGFKMTGALLAVALSGVLAWYLTGNQASAEVRVLSTIGGAAGAAAILFVVKLLTLPPKLAAEAAEEKERLRQQNEGLTAALVYHERLALHRGVLPPAPPVIGLQETEDALVEDTVITAQGRPHIDAARSKGAAFRRLKLDDPSRR